MEPKAKNSIIKTETAFILNSLWFLPFNGDFGLLQMRIRGHPVLLKPSH
ncbi:MAG: hypothetical protein ACYSO4_09040 [Planctomycetota bacterium]|jgi:hypothetical protein